MKTKRVALLLVSAAFMAVLVLGRHANGTGSTDPLQVTVLVKDAAGAFNIPRAHVSVQSEAGAVLAEATSGADGIAYLQVKDHQKAARILVEAQGYYIGGLKWLPGAREVCVHLALLRTCDLFVAAPAK